MTFLTRKQNGTTEFHSNSEERTAKQESKQNNSNNRRTKMVKGKIYIKIVKIEAEEEVLVKKEQITTGLQNKMQKVIKTKITPHQQNQQINIAATKISINLGNSTVLENNKKTKQHLMWL